MSQLRPQHITMRVHPSEGNRIRQTAASHNESVSAYIRRLISEDAARAARKAAA